MEQEFNRTVKKIISEYLDCKIEKVYCVWQCKTLQHVKGLFSANVSNAKGLYWEATYNGLTNELYLDRYKKEENQAIKINL